MDVSAQPALHSLEPPVLLADGLEFKTWEQPQRFERSYYVDQAHPAASDTNAGTRDRPFATINRAAQVPAQANLEITTQEAVFAPEEPGLGYIRVKGFTIEHAVGPFPGEQVGAPSTN